MTVEKEITDNFSNTKILKKNKEKKIRSLENVKLIPETVYKL